MQQQIGAAVVCFTKLFGKFSHHASHGSACACCCCYAGKLVPTVWTQLLHRHKAAHSREALLKRRTAKAACE
jgi:hypothetical protein